MINLQTSTFESEIKHIARCMMRHGVDRELGAPKGASVKIEGHLGIITIVWTGQGKTFSVDQFVPASTWEEAKAGNMRDQYIGLCIRGMKKELSKLKRDHLWAA